MLTLENTSKIKICKLHDQNQESSHQKFILRILFTSVFDKLFVNLENRICKFYIDNLHF